MKWTAVRDATEEATWRVEARGRSFSVDIGAAGFSPGRLEEAVLEALGMPLTPTAATRWSIRERIEAHGQLFELEEDTVWTVYDGERPVWEFRGGTSHDYDGVGWSAATGSHGCDFVVMGCDGLHVIAGDRFGVTCHPLPDARAET